MKNFKIFKSILCSLLIVSLSLSLFGCVLNDVEDDPIESGTDTKGATDTETETDIPNYIKYDKVKDYQIIEDEDGYYYLVFDDISVYESIGHPSSLDFTMTSYEEFLDRLLNGELTFYEKRKICSFIGKDDKGVRILDPHYSYKLSHSSPHQVDYEKIQYHGPCVVLTLECEEYPTNYPIDIVILDAIEYHRDYNAAFGNYTKDESKIEYEITLANGEIVTCYNKIVETRNKKTKEKYVLSNGTKDVFVSKIYLDDSITPHQIYLCYNINDTVYFDFTVYKSIFSNGEFPDDEFWFGFNVEVIDNAQTA